MSNPRVGIDQSGILWAPMLLLLVAAVVAVSSEPVRLPCIADTWIQSPPWARGAGGTPAAQGRGGEPELVLNGRNDFALLQFDFAGVRGKTIRSARLRVYRKPAPVPLAMVGLSTISGSAPWSERDATFMTSGARPWTYPGSDLTDVTFSLGGSLYDYVRPRDAGDGWWEIDVPVPIVTALATGDQFGLMLTDEKGQMRTRHSIGSRESPHPPSLLVEAAPPEGAPPGAVAARTIDGTPETARALGRTGLRPGSVILRFGGARAARYELRCSRQPITSASFGAADAVARWMMDPLAPKPAPLARANSLADEVTAIVEDLVPGQTYHFAARAIDAAGRAGPVTQLGSRRAYDRAFPELPAAAAAAVRERPAPTPRPVVWAAPELVKIDPRTGDLLEAAHYPDHRAANPVWNAADSTVTLRGARNEFVAFQIAVEGAPLDVTVAGPIFAECKLPPVLQSSGAISIFREWFVPDDKNTGPDRPWYADALIPWGTKAGPNGVPGQSVEVAFVDVYIPRDAAAGVHRGRLRVRDREIALQVEVLPFALPDDLGFVVDLNGYGGVNSGYGLQRGTPEYRRLLHSYHRLAHLNRGTLDILGYSHSGSVEPDQTPRLEGEGAATRVASWADFDAHFGPLLDGSAFAGLPRGRVPVTNIYLPFFENWPGDLRKSYKHNHYPVAKTVEEYRDVITRHALEAAPIEQSFPQEYQDRFSAVVRQFAEHFRERGWLRTKYQVYFNDKYYYKDPSQHPRPNGVSWWLLDEPNHRDDVRAISFFAWLTKRWLGDHKDVPIVLRTDISYIDFIRDLLAGQIDLDCTSGHFLSKNRYLMDHRDRFGRVYWNYASTNHPRETNTSMRAWCWRAWLGGADGIVPWNTIRGMEAWERAEPLTVFYVGQKFGADEPFPSLRLKAFRRGQQDMEYLLLLARKKGWDREAVTRAVAAAARLDVGIAQQSEEDAGAVTFRGASDREFEHLLDRVAAALK
jgi:hypothetical protein